MQTIAVLITVFNRKDKTLECLRKLYIQLPIEGHKVDIYLTNDKCTDGTPEAVKKEFPEVNIINGDGNLFWNRGMYTAWKEAAKKDYDYYLWLNDDTFVFYNMFASLLSAAETKNNKAIIVGPTQSSITKETTYGGRLRRSGEIPNPNGNLTKVDYFNGNIVLVPKYVYEKLGNLDFYFKHSKGDFDYGLRAYKAGIEIYQTGIYLGYCELHSSLDKWCSPDIPFKQRWKALYLPNGMPPKETFYFERKHYGFLLAVFHYITVHLRCLYPNLWIKLNKTKM